MKTYRVTFTRTSPRGTVTHGHTATVRVLTHGDVHVAPEVGALIILNDRHDGVVGIQTMTEVDPDAV